MRREGATVIVVGQRDSQASPQGRSAQHWRSDLESQGLPPDPWRPFHVHPNDLYQVQKDRGRQTWKVIADVVAPDPAHLEAVLRQGAEPGLGDLTYQIERSGLPALRAALQERTGAPDLAKWNLKADVEVNQILLSPPQVRLSPLRA
jgi:hypothetical protein